MQLTLIGKAPIDVLQELKIVSPSLASKLADLDYTSGYLQTRTSSSEREILEILGFKESDPSTYWVTNTLFTEAILSKLQKVLDMAGEPEHIPAIKRLKETGTFIAFIDYFA